MLRVSHCSKPIAHQDKRGCTERRASRRRRSAETGDVETPTRHRQASENGCGLSGPQRDQPRLASWSTLSAGRRRATPWPCLGRSRWPRTLVQADPVGSSTATAETPEQPDGQLPRPSSIGATGQPTPQRRHPRSTANLSPDQGQLALDASQVGNPAGPIDDTDTLTVSPPTPVRRNRVGGMCERCRVWIDVGAGETVRFGGRDMLRCHPSCAR